MLILLAIALFVACIFFAVLTVKLIVQMFMERPRP